MNDNKTVVSAGRCAQVHAIRVTLKFLSWNKFFPRSNTWQFLHLPNLKFWFFCVENDDFFYLIYSPHQLAWALAAYFCQPASQVAPPSSHPGRGARKIVWGRFPRPQGPLAYWNWIKSGSWIEFQAGLDKDFFIKTFSFSKKNEFSFFV